jgi:hypothetical protein
MTRACALVLACAAAACRPEPPDSQPPARSPPAATTAPSEGEAWLLAGTTDERFARVAKHLRGFDVAMAETGYRYGELYWAGQDKNWDYARYQVSKIRTAVANGVERRPKRAASAQALEAGLGPLEEAIAAKDSALFAERFTSLTALCNACHEAEKVPFVHVRPPSVRASPAGPPPASPARPSRRPREVPCDERLDASMLRCQAPT